MAIAGELAALIERIQGQAYKVTSLALIRNESGHRFPYHALWNRFEEARKRAANTVAAAGNGDAAVDVRGFQFRVVPGPATRSLRPNDPRNCGTRRFLRNEMHPQKPSNAAWILVANQGLEPRTKGL
jgi:hypothetical protein